MEKLMGQRAKIGLSWNFFFSPSLPTTKELCTLDPICKPTVLIPQNFLSIAIKVIWNEA